MTPVDLSETLSETFELLVGSPLAPSAEPPSPDHRRVIRLSGGWNGCVVLECETGVAAAVSAHFGGGDSQAELEDAAAELANMFSGALKSMLPGPTSMSVPLEESPAEPSLAQAYMAAPGGRVRVALYEEA